MENIIFKDETITVVDYGDYIVTQDSNTAIKHLINLNQAQQAKIEKYEQALKEIVNLKVSIYSTLEECWESYTILHSIAQEALEEK